MQPTHDAELVATTRALMKTVSHGFDSISTKILHDTIEEIATSLTHIFNRSFLTGIVPDNMKIGKIVLVSKSGDNKVLNNYRPISNIPAFSKLLEKILCNRLIHFLETYNLLYIHQYGFRKKTTTIHAVLQLIKDVSENSDKQSKDITLAVFLDSSRPLLRSAIISYYRN